MEIGGTTLHSLVPQKLQEQETVSGIYSSGDPDAGQADFPFYRRLTGAGARDLPQLIQERMQGIALLLYRINPLGHRIIELTTSFAVGGGATFQAESPKVQEILEAHWHHPINAWDRLLYQRAFELGLYGELFMPVKVTKKGGVTLGYISPLNVKTVYPDPIIQNQPDVIEFSVPILAQSMFPAEPSPTPGETQKLKAIRYQGDPKGKDYGFRAGETFFFSVNKVTDNLRGISDLLPLADYIDGFDQFLFNLLEKASAQNMFIWDVTLEGMNQNQIDTWLRNFQAAQPRPGSVRAHNEAVKWDTVSPTLGGSDNADQARLFRNYILGGAGFPEWFFGESGSGGRAVASEMAEPTLKTLKTRQREVRDMIAEVFDFVIDQAFIHKSLPIGTPRRFTISMPNISLRDIQRTSSALYRASQALSLLKKEGFITQERGAAIATELLNEFGFEGERLRGIGSQQEASKDLNG
jgi:hypothetical protein